MFITRKKHEAIVAEVQACLDRVHAEKSDAVIAAANLRVENHRMACELERFRSGRARSNAALAAANAARSEAARGKGE